jgi:hypothetical protein
MNEKTYKDGTGGALLELALESWRFQKLFVRAMSKLDAGESLRFANQHRYFVRRIEDCLVSQGLRLVSIEGQSYDTGTAVTALNIGDFGPNDILVVDQMIEPIVMNESGLVRTGTVTLRKNDQ